MEPPLVYFEKMDNTQICSINIANEKTRSATLFKRPPKVFEDTLAPSGGGLVVLGVPRVFPFEGGIPPLEVRNDRGVPVLMALDRKNSRFKITRSGRS
jgi:uncharacterized protein GlcG (DUF336 family)